MAVALASLLMTPVVGILSSSRRIHERMQADELHLDNMYGALRHIARQLRTAKSVTFVRSGRNGPTRLNFIAADGQVAGWTHDRQSGRFMFEQSGNVHLLAENIRELTFATLDANGKPAQTASQIRTVRCTVTTQLNRKSNVTRSSTCTVWIRPPF